MSKALKCDRCGKFFEHEDMKKNMANVSIFIICILAFLMHQILV